MKLIVIVARTAVRSGLAREIVIVVLGTVLAVQQKLLSFFLLQFWQCNRNCAGSSCCSSGRAREIVIVVLAAVLAVQENVRSCRQ